MKVRLIRHATLMVEYKDQIILVDPVFGAAGTKPAISDTLNDRRNPLVELPDGIDFSGIDAILLTHTHGDHFDEAAAEQLHKGLPLFCQPADQQKLSELGFTCVHPVTDEHLWRGIRLTRTGGRHGSGEIGRMMGTVSGYVLQADGEARLYIAGDTVWCPEVADALTLYQPDYIILFGGEARFRTGDPITMTTSDMQQVCTHAPGSQVAVVHMETFNHCMLTRQTLREYLIGHNLSGQVHVPEDGAWLFVLK